MSPTGRTSHLRTAAITPLQGTPIKRPRRLWLKPPAENMALRVNAQATKRQVKWNWTLANDKEALLQRQARCHAAFSLLS